MDKQTIEIGQIASGMTLAAPILNEHGQVIMPAGIRLTPMFIVRLKRLNIASVEIVPSSIPKAPPSGGTSRRTNARPAGSATPAKPAAPSMSEEDKEFARQVALDVSTCFAALREDKMMMELRNAAIKRLVAHGKDGMINIMRAAAAARESDE